ncbi:polysaccharide biosynthesis tyrosine autokinase [Arthrobacter sp. MA-N2]|uniref:polysaccharide biosynthesis tyrosine autokinase n=1 Tax=Arthrobacter sp. MA-N2 TaxID=1101188 RepID=UPI000487EA0F|nr:polysaccharide biosynthesis tyrosine autokinase [Arthrobacter sp. MA-N2]
MDLRDYLVILRRNWITIVAATLAGLLVGASVAILTKPTYTADTQLFVAIQGSGSIQELQQGNTFSQARIQSYVKTVSTPVVLQPAIDSLGLNTTPERLQSQVRATADPNTVLINISVVDDSPSQAAAIAQAVAASLITAVAKLERPTSTAPSVVSLSIIRPATAPSVPSAPNTRTTMLMGLVIGLILGIGIAFVRSTLDNKVRGETELRRITDVAILGGIAHEPDAGKNPLLTQVHHQSPRAESFRQLRTNLQFANVSSGAKTLTVTSSLPGEGKSTTAANLAIALAETGHKVCLVDADLRRPMLDAYLGLDRNAGLTTALVGQADVQDLLQPWGDSGLAVLTSGQIPPNPSELLGSRNMEGLIQRLEAIFDYIVIDAPPLLPVTDAAVLAQHTGGVLMVVASQAVKEQDLLRALTTLKMVGADVLGIVLNKLPVNGPDAYGYRYYSHESAESANRDESPGRRARGRALNRGSNSKRMPSSSKS